MVVIQICILVGLASVVVVQVFGLLDMTENF